MNIEYNRKQSISAVKRAVALAGGQTCLANLINAKLPKKQHICQVHIYQWMNRPAISPVPPAEYVLPMAFAIDFKITPSEIRNDLYPPELVQVAV